MVATSVRQPKTYADYLNTPEDGRKHELIDGEIVVCAAPAINHQRIVGRFFRWLSDVADRFDGDEAFFAPVAVSLDPINTFEPDIVYRRRDSKSVVEVRRILGAPELVVEVLSPGTASRDQIRKRSIYQSAGVSEYWITDPVRKTVVALSLQNGRYRELRPVNDQTSSVAVPEFVVNIVELFKNID